MECLSKRYQRYKATGICELPSTMRRSGLHLMTNNDQWYIKNGRIELKDFFLNYDFDTKDYSYSAEALKTAVISSSLPVKGNKIIIDEDRKVLYEKIK